MLRPTNPTSSFIGALLLLAGASHTAAQEGVPAADAPHAAVTDTADRPLLAAAATAVVGGAAFWLAWTQFELAMQYRMEFHSNDDPLIKRVSRDYYDTVGDHALLTAAVGAAVLSTSVPMALPNYEDAPALAWIGGVIGIAGLTAGTVLAAVSNPCCEQGGVDPHVGPMVLLQSAPFLAVPLTYLVRSLLDDGETTVNVSADAGRYGATIGGSF